MGTVTSAGKWTLFARICLALTVTILFGSILSGLGNRSEWWGFRTGLSLLRWTVYAEIFLAIISLAGFILALSRTYRKGLIIFSIIMIINLAALIIPVRIWLQSRNLPAIHDITTDTKKPPLFEAVIALRKGAVNPVKYGGKEIAEQQLRYYPDIQPLEIELKPSQTFQKSLSAAKRLGWTIISADAENGYIEATDTTFWFGFTDDIVIRVNPLGKGSRVDVRSLSRVGKKDWGTNAERIRKFMNAMKKNTGT